MALARINACNQRGSLARVEVVTLHPALMYTPCVAAAAAVGCRHLYLSNCAIGISALLFALKVVLNHDAPTYSSILGFSLPTKVSCVSGVV
jgi:hypothetical protein